jgi:probable F420-dependent oxidoreductase
VASIPCGIGIPQNFSGPKLDLKQIRDFAPRAEALGYESLWVQEQIIGDSPLLEPVALMTYVAALTSKARIGSSVLLLVIRNPIQLAKSLATLDQLSGGRLIAGVAVGGPHMPEKIFNVAGGKRSRRFIEALEVMRALWTQPKAVFKGEYWQLDGVPMEPKPLQKPHPPLWFGARTDIGLRRAARLGDGWMGAGSTSTADFAEHVKILRRALEEHRRDPAKFPISKRVYLAIDDNRERADRRLREWFQMRYRNAAMAPQVSIWGSVAECTDKLREVVRAGAQHLLLNPVFDEMEHAEVLAREVMPHLAA